MKIFIDSAKLSEIEEAYCCGILDGVTTNPSLIKAAATEAGTDLEEYIKKILIVASGTPVSLEVTEFTFEGMVNQGRILYERFNPVAENVYIKIPVNPSFEGDRGKEFEGIRAIKALSKEGIPVNCTLIFTPEQALMAAKAGAKIVSPFAGRIDDFIRKKAKIDFEKTDYFPAGGLDEHDDNGIVSGLDLVAEIVGIFETYGFKAEVLAASLRNARQVREAALAGADIATMPMYVIKELMVHHKTQEGMKGFTADVIPEYSRLGE